MVVADNVLNFTKRFEDFIWSSTTNASPFSPLVAWKFTKSVRDKTYIDTLLRRWWRYILFYLSFSIRKCPEYPVDTQPFQRLQDVYTTSPTLYRRLTDAETTQCVYWMVIIYCVKSFSSQCIPLFQCFSIFCSIAMIQKPVS